jgi:hypothetical protein
MFTALLNALRRRFGLRVKRWPMATFPRRPRKERFHLVKRDGFIYIEPRKPCA